MYLCDSRARHSLQARKWRHGAELQTELLGKTQAAHWGYFRNLFVSVFPFCLFVISCKLSSFILPWDASQSTNCTLGQFQYFYFLFICLFFVCLVVVVVVFCLFVLFLFVFLGFFFLLWFFWFWGCCFFVFFWGGVHFTQLWDATCAEIMVPSAENPQLSYLSVLFLFTPGIGPV